MWDENYSQSVSQVEQHSTNLEITPIPNGENVPTPSHVSDFYILLISYF